jgi:predicted small lipoprotein YifL
MLQHIRPHHLPLGLQIASGVLVIAGLGALWAAVTFQGYISALLLLALAGCGFAGARELAAKHKETDTHVLADQPGPTPGDSF